MKTRNRLKDEISPYLLQHADNPVAWFAWNDEAFLAAREQDKPIFLSIGYSTCHWCHVMAHECFEDEEVARLMNEAFISIKVDREELPHIDAIYMNVCQMMTGSGGWPLTIIMTPDKKPFFAATYLPKHSRHGIIGMTELIPRITRIWDSKRDEILKSAETISREVKNALKGHGQSELHEDLLHETFQRLAARFSRTYGGFGEAPKFPTPHNLMFLLRYARRTGDERALNMTTKTLDAMRMGGIYDQVGFGFHRYSTDAQWLVPHFEKMLYDQALLAIVYTEAFLATENPLYKKTAEEILQYVLRDMVSEDGLFLSAEDADSEGREGKFYLWKDSELRSILDSEDYHSAVQVFSTTESGNTSVEELQGENILHLKEMPQQVAQRFGVDEHQLRKSLERIRKILFEQRELRVRPFRDDKALTDWNGLMIAAFAGAAQAFGNEEYTRAAVKAAAFILENMVGGDGRLFHVFCEGSPLREATADDYAFFIWGLIELYETTFDTMYLDTAVSLARTCIRHHLDREHGGFFLTADDAEVIIARTKESYDGALPSSNSVLMLDLLRLAKLSGDTDFEQEAQGIAQFFSRSITHSPDAHTFMMTAFNFLLGPTHEVVISGSLSSDDTHEMIRVLRSQFLPHVVVMVRPETTDGTKLPGHIMDKVSLNGRATAYVCTNMTCKRPTTDVSELLSVLANKPGG